MRSLFSFPLPCTTTLAAAVPLQPEICHRPHPAPMRRRRRSPALLSAARPLPGPALTGPRPTVTRPAAPPSLPRAAARSHRTPSPEYHPAAARAHWIRLARIAPNACRRPHRIYPAACRHPHPSMSPPSRSRAHRPPHHTHRAPPSASPSRVASAASRPRTPPPAAPPIAVGVSADRALPAVLVLPTPMHLATCAPHPSRQPRGPTASRKQAEQHKQLNAGIKIGSPNGDPIEELFGFTERLPDAPLPLHQANELALSYLDHSTR